MSSPAITKSGRYSTVAETEKPTRFAGEMYPYPVPARLTVSTWRLPSVVYEHCIGKKRPMAGERSARRTETPRFNISGQIFGAPKSAKSFQRSSGLLLMIPAQPAWLAASAMAMRTSTTRAGLREVLDFARAAIGKGPGAKGKARPG